MTLFTTVDPRPIHFMGIAGAGMSGLALLAKEQGAAITGCDSDPTGAADLAAIGVEIWRGHDPGHVAGARALVVTAAVPGEHPELTRARALGVPVVRRADALSQAVAGGTVVAVSGTHGKTTTTVMVTEALAAAGRDPTGLAGGRVARWGGNARVGGRDLYVVEADEYDRAFLSLAPAVAVVNNVEADHLECYDGSVAALEQAVAQFAGRARRVIAGGDDAGALRVVSAVRAPVWRVGLGVDADVRIADAQVDERGSTARIELPDGRVLVLRLRVPGLHNVRNAAAALAVVHELGADLERALAALAEFTGVGRRFERVGEVGGVMVVDDYAHHPTEVEATLAAARQAFPRRRVVAVFQPHLFSRTALHGDALGRALAAADVVVVAPIYGARGRPLPGVRAALLVLSWLGAPFVLRRLAMFRVRQIELVGVRNLAPDAVIAALRLGPRASVFGDTRLLADRVRGLAGVAEARVVRRLPAVLSVELREVEPAALVVSPRGSGRGLVAVDAAGRPLPFDPARSGLDLPIAASGDSGVVAVLALIQSVDPALFQTITGARTFTRGGVLLEIGPHRVLVGRDAGPEVIRAVVLVSQELAAKRRAYVELDARFAGQVVVRRRATASGGGEGA